MFHNAAHFSKHSIHVNRSKFLKKKCNTVKQFEKLMSEA